MTLGQFTEPKLLIPRLLSDRQEGAIQELAALLEITARIQNAPAFVQAVLKRESEFPTFVAKGVAVPHLRGEMAQKLSLALGLSSVGIPWGPNKLMASVVFLFAIPSTEAQAYLSLLSGLSSLVREAGAFDALGQATQPEEMLKVLNTISLRMSAANG